MEKHQTLKDIIKVLAHEFPFAYTIDYWDADMCAIGLKAGIKLVYISTWAMVRDEEIVTVYEYSFELEPTDDADDNISISDMKKADEQTMLVDIKLFFETEYFLG